ncbi:hypothetical protein POVCU2_0036370 [Plasmodium ovale curtisi]|uniref:Uncharacterized protein n=1 Tax=Plasmodium ovale curtisi TaxID=864141 RepID=A0A1A8W0K4_PLAOA|nr:hypothetical protein POVCU2_0036370 [Plasmodium ovale curtisi]SBS96668.1 hypothetical protein POVCU1_033350 [Plasmodium ovale curtisi]
MDNLARATRKKGEEKKKKNEKRWLWFYNRVECSSSLCASASSNLLRSFCFLGMFSQLSFAGIPCPFSLASIPRPLTCSATLSGLRPFEGGDVNLVSQVLSFGFLLNQF